MLSRRVQPALWVLFSLIATGGPGDRAWAAPLGTAFTFQGQLKQDGAPAPDGTYQMSFILYDGPEPLTATQLGTLGPLSVTVSDGLFSQPLDFGPTPFEGNAVWLRLFVEGTPLSPLQEITAGPYALFALDSTGGGNSPWEVNGSNVYYTGGNVGIGIATPDNTLMHVGTADGTLLKLGDDPEMIFTRDTANNKFSISLGGTGYSGRFLQLGRNDGNHNIAMTGNVGIGETSPQAKLHVLTQDLAMPSSALENDEIIIEAQDAVLGLYSSAQGDWASAIALKEITGGALVDTWGIARRTSTAASAPSSLRFTYGESDNYATNPSQLTIKNNGDVELFGAKLDLMAPGTTTIETLSNTGILIDGTANFVQLRADNTTVLTANNAGNVGIGTSSPDNKLSVAGTMDISGSLGVGTATPADKLHVWQGNVRLERYGDAVRPRYEGLRARGTETSPTPVVASDQMLQLEANGYDGTGFFRGAEVGFRSTETWNSTAHGSEIRFNTTANGTSNLTERMRITHDGNVLVQTPGARLKTPILEITGADLAEKFPVRDRQAAEPGTVMEIDPDHPGHLRVARGACNRRVAGVVSGANGLSVGAVLGNLPGHEDAPPIALSGRVWVKCDSSNAPIAPGDLLTTSGTPGHAMKVADHAAARGAIIGKAMTGLETGKGMVLVLVQPQ